MRVQTGDDHGLDAQFLEQDIEIGLEEAAVAALGHDIVLVAQLQFRNHLGAGRALEGVVAPELELLVDAGQVAVVAENDGNALLAGGPEQALGGGDDGFAAVAGKRTGHEVVEHVNDQDGRMIQMFHILAKTVFALQRYG